MFLAETGRIIVNTFVQRCEFKQFLQLKKKRFKWHKHADWCWAVWELRRGVDAGSVIDYNCLALWCKDGCLPKWVNKHNYRFAEPWLSIRAWFRLQWPTCVIWDPWVCTWVWKANIRSAAPVCSRTSLAVAKSKWLDQSTVALLNYIWGAEHGPINVYFLVWATFDLDVWCSASPSALLWHVVYLQPIYSRALCFLHHGFWLSYSH